MRPHLPGVVLAGLLLVACGGDDEAATPTTDISPTIAEATTTTAPDPYVKVQVDPDLPRQDIDINVRYPREFTEEQAEVAAALANQSHATLAAYDPPDPTSKLFERNADAETTRTNRARAERLRAAGQTYRLPRDSSSRVTVVSASVDGTSAELVACDVNDVELVSAADGNVISGGVRTTEFGYRLEQVGGDWLITLKGTTVMRTWGGNEEDQCL